MSYVTNEDIQIRLGLSTYVQLTDDDNDGSADGAVVDEARLAAEGEVNGFLARRFATPIDVVAFPELAGVLKSITLDLVELRLRSRRPPVSEQVFENALRAMDWLRGVSEGRIALPASSELPGSNSSGIAAKVIGTTRVLTREELAGF